MIEVFVVKNKVGINLYIFLEDIVFVMGEEWRVLIWVIGWRSFNSWL